MSETLPSEFSKPRKVSTVDFPGNEPAVEPWGNNQSPEASSNKPEDVVSPVLASITNKAVHSVVSEGFGDNRRGRVEVALDPNETK